MKNIAALLFLFFLQQNIFSQQSNIIKSGDGFLHYKIFGKGKPILIINGGPGMNSDGFDGIATLLSGNNMTITYDQRGTGKSTLPKIDANTISMNLMVADIETLRNHLKIDKWIILGHSFGGMLASYYTTIHPEHIEGLILSSSGGLDLGLLSYMSIQSRLSKEESDSLNYWNAKIDAGDTSYHARLGRGMALAPAYVFNREFIPLIAERLTQGNSKINNLVWDDMRKIKFDCTNKLRTFDKPVLIIQGQHDIIEEKTANKAHEVFKKSTVVLLDHSVHYGWLDNKEGYLSAVKKFLASL